MRTPTPISRNSGSSKFSRWPGLWNKLLCWMPTEDVRFSVPVVPRQEMFSPQLQDPVKEYPAALIRFPALEPPEPVWENVSVSSIHWLWPCAAVARLPLDANGCFESADIVPEASPSFSPMPLRAASPAGSSRARLTSSSRYCSCAVSSAIVDPLFGPIRRYPQAAESGPNRQSGEPSQPGDHRAAPIRRLALSIWPTFLLPGGVHALHDPPSSQRLRLIDKISHKGSGKIVTEACSRR